MSSSPNYPRHIESLKPYVPGVPISDLARRLNIETSSIVKLASNENPLGASPKALRALADAKIDMSRYPDNDCVGLVNAIASKCDVPADWVVVGAGSEGVIGTAVATTLTIGRGTLYSQYSFQAYVNAAHRAGATAVVVPSPEYVVDLKGMRTELASEPSLIYIANPGNPTGTVVDPDELEAFIASVPSHVVVILDEAYFEYMPLAVRGDSVALVKRYPNLLVTRTFSKAYGLAGLRIGYGIAQAPLADMLRRARPPFTVSETAQLCAEAALSDTSFLAESVKENKRGLGQLYVGFAALGLRYLPSSTNFILVEVGDGVGMARALEQHALIVRPVGAYGLPAWLRVSVGRQEENKQLLDAMAHELPRFDKR